MLNVVKCVFWAPPTRGLALYTRFSSRWRNYCKRCQSLHGLQAPGENRPHLITVCMGAGTFRPPLPRAGSCRRTQTAFLGNNEQEYTEGKYLWCRLQLTQNEHCPSTHFSLSSLFSDTDSALASHRIRRKKNKKQQHMLFSLEFSGSTPRPHFCFRKTADVSPLVPFIIATVCPKDD